MRRFLKKVFPDRTYRPLLWIDIEFSTILIAISSIPLILLRNTDWFNNETLVIGLVTGWLVVCATWVVISNRVKQNLNLPVEFVSKYLPNRSQPFKEIILVSSSLIIFTIIAFYIPMRQHYWIGMDEPILIDAQRHLWSEYYDELASRPLSTISAFISGNLTPGSLEGYLLFNFASRLLLGLLIYASLKLLLNRPTGIPFIAAVLFIVNPSEQLRFAGIFMNSFYGGGLIAASAMYLFILSYRRDRRWLLALACVLEGIALLHYEAVYFITLSMVFIIPILGWRWRLWTWAYAWIGTMALCSLRFIIYYISTDLSYQAGYALEIERNFSFFTILKNFYQLFIPLFKFIESIDSVWRFGLYGILATLIIFIPLCINTRWVDRTPSRKIYLIGLGVGFVYLLLTITPWVIIPIPNVPDLVENPTLRYEFAASLPQSVLWALGIGLIGTFLARRGQQIWTVVATSLLVIFSVSDGYALQAHNGFWNPAVEFETVSHIFQQVNELMPPLQTDSTVFFALDEDVPSPFGWTYHVHLLTCLFFGVPGYQGMISDVPSWYVRGLAGYPPPAEYYLSYSLPNVVLFRVSPQGEVTLEPTPDLPPAPEGSLSVEACRIPKVETTPGAPLPYLLEK